MRRRKRLIPTLFLTILSWGALGYLVYNTSPHQSLPVQSPIPIPTLPLFFMVLLLALFLSFALLLNNTRRGFLIAIGLVAIAILRFFHLFHPLYIILIIGLLLTIELYFLKR